MKLTKFVFLHGESTGILRYLYQYDDYWDMFTYDSTGENNINQKTKNAFDFGTTDYWMGITLELPNNISFCFNDFYVMPTGYEIIGSLLDSQPYIWGFSGSKDGEYWENYEPEKTQLVKNTTHYVSWNPRKRFKCFQLTCIESTKGYINRFDLQNLDVYGYIDTNQMTYKQNRFLLFLFQYIILQSMHLIICI